MPSNNQGNTDGSPPHLPLPLPPSPKNAEENKESENNKNKHQQTITKFLTTPTRKLPTLQVNKRSTNKKKKNIENEKEGKNFQQLRGYWVDFAKKQKEKQEKEQDATSKMKNCSESENLEKKLHINSSCSNYTSRESATAAIIQNDEVRGSVNPDRSDVATGLLNNNLILQIRESDAIRKIIGLLRLSSDRL